MTGSLQFSRLALQQYLHSIYPQTAASIQIESLLPYEAIIRLNTTDDSLRPGGTVSGPSLFTAADCSFYCAVLGMIGPKPMAVTSNLSISFYRRAKQTDIIGHATIHKLGRKLAMGTCLLYSDGEEEPIAQASVTYAIPQEEIH